jgi:hypothetical protein
MQTKCTLKGIGSKGKHYSPGDIIFAPWLVNSSILGPDYRKNWQDLRLPILICLPNPRLWSPDLLAADDTTGWIVTGEIETSLTISPSVICIEPNGVQYTYKVSEGYIIQLEGVEDEQSQV